MSCESFGCGTLTGPKNGCRCPETNALRSEYEKRRLYDSARGRSRNVPALGTQRRLRALAYMGWPVRSVLAEVGLASSQQCAHNMLHRRRFVRRITAAAIAELYERLCMSPGPSRQARNTARRLCWPPPLAWDDIDDPDCVPDYGTTDPIDVYRRIHMDDLEWLLDNGESVEAIAERMGVSWRSLEKASDRAGRHDLARKVRVA